MERPDGAAARDMTLFRLFAAVAALALLVPAVLDDHLLSPGSALADDDDDGGGDDDGGDDDGGDDDGGDDNGGGRRGGGGGGGGSLRGGDDDRDRRGEVRDRIGAPDDDDAAPPARPRRQRPRERADDRPSPPTLRPVVRRLEWDVVPNEVVVGGEVEGPALEELTRMGFAVVETRELPSLGLTLTRLRVPGDLTTDAARDLLRRRFPDLPIDLHHLYRPYRPAGSASLPGPNYAFDMVGWDAVGECGTDVTVALIDTRLDHRLRSALGERLETRDFAGDAAVLTDHGSALAALLVGGNGDGAALLPGARLLSASVFRVDDRGRLIGSVLAIAEALDWLTERGAPVAALGLAGPPSAILDTAVERASDAGLLVVAAVGNDGPEADPAYPAAHPAVVAVTAVDHREAVYDLANQGDYVDIAAPGVRVSTPRADGRPRFVTGTSFAVPFVAAALAIEARHGPLGHDVALDFLADNAQDLGSPGRDPVFGIGLLRMNESCGEEEAARLEGEPPG